MLIQLPYLQLYMHIHLYTCTVDTYTGIANYYTLYNALHSIIRQYTLYIHAQVYGHTDSHAKLTHHHFFCFFSYAYKPVFTFIYLHFCTL